MSEGARKVLQRWQNRLQNVEDEDERREMKGKCSQAAAELAVLDAQAPIPGVD